MSPRIAPIPAALAVLMAAAPFIDSVGATPMNPQVAATPPPLAAGKTPKASEKSQLRKIVLKTGMAGGKMVYLDEKGTVNPMMRGNVGDTIEITIASGEGAQHDIVFEGLNVKSAMFDGKSGPAKLSFKLTQSGKFTYFCSVPGHRQIGMEGVLEVTGPADASAARRAPARRRCSAPRSPASRPEAHRPGVAPTRSASRWTRTPCPRPSARARRSW